MWKSDSGDHCKENIASKMLENDKYLRHPSQFYNSNQHANEGSILIQKVGRILESRDMNK